MTNITKRSTNRLNLFKDSEFDFQLLRTLGKSVVSVGECLYTASQIEDNNPDSWVKAWQKTAEKIKLQAEIYKQKRQDISAKEAFYRAALYFRTAEYYGLFAEPTKKENWKNSKYCFTEGLKLSGLYFEELNVPFEDMILRGYYISEDNNKTLNPTLMAISGFDGTPEELFFTIGQAAVVRGYNIILFEGPGQVSSLHTNVNNYFRPDYEKPISNIIDFTLTKEQVDPNKLALIGFSLGSYFAARGIIHDSRIKACILDSPIIDMYSYFMGFEGIKVMENIKPSGYEAVYKEYPLFRWAIDSFTKRFGVSIFHEVLEKMKEYNIIDQEHLIKCPTLSLIGEGEGSEALSQSETFYKNVSGAKSKYIFSIEEGADSHCQVSNTSLMNAIIFDWLEETFNAT